MSAVAMRACPLARGTGCSRASPAPAAARAVHPAPRRCVATRAAALEKEVVDSSSISPYLRVSILSEALPYLQKFRGKTVVIKYGGAGEGTPGACHANGAFGRGGAARCARWPCT